VGKTIFGCGRSRDGRPVCWRSYDARAHVPILSKNITGRDELSRLLTGLFGYREGNGQRVVRSLSYCS
jgi:hypothetical protein